MAKAPKGGTTITDGVLYEKFYKGGQFLPNDVPPAIRKGRRLLAKVNAGEFEYIKIWHYGNKVSIYLANHRSQIEDIYRAKFEQGMDENSFLCQLWGMAQESKERLGLPLEITDDYLLFKFKELGLLA